MAADIYTLSTRLQYANNGNFSQLPLALDVGQAYAASNTATPDPVTQVGAPLSGQFLINNDAGTYTIDLSGFFTSVGTFVLYNRSLNAFYELQYSYQVFANSPVATRVAIAPNSNIVLNFNQGQSYGGATTMNLLVATPLVVTAHLGTTGTIPFRGAWAAIGCQTL